MLSVVKEKKSNGYSIPASWIVYVEIELIAWLQSESAVYHCSAAVTTW